MKDKKQTTVYEDREEKRRKYAEEHFIECPHCGDEVLDHMTKCPHCGGKLEPKGYQPLTDQQIKKIKLIAYPICMVVAVVILILYFTLWQK